MYSQRVIPTIDLIVRKLVRTYSLAQITGTKLNHRYENTILALVSVIAIDQLLPGPVEWCLHSCCL